jgi:hypothetical protein
MNPSCTEKIPFIDLQIDPAPQNEIAFGNPWPLASDLWPLIQNCELRLE